MPRRSIPLIEYLWQRIERRAGGCWMWLGHIDRDGYGRTKGGGAAYRVLYELLVEPIPVALQLDHRCRVRACVNPSHLEVVTGRENTDRGTNYIAVNRAKVGCLRGHPFDSENTYIDPRGRRHCRACQQVREANYRARRRTGRAA